MPIDLLSSIRKTSHWAFGSPILNSILGSSIFVALAIAIIMILIIMFMYPAKSGTPFSIVGKMFIYMFFITLMVIFLHDGVIKYMFEDELSDKAGDDIMQGTTMLNKNVVYNNTPTINPNIQPMSLQPIQQQSQPIQQQPIKPLPIVSYVEGGGGGVLRAKPAPQIQKNPYM